ncbi:hypothetical protein DOTSEDRAFT_23337 [Dothistroma septosporum NZE10]|uniref:Uncharacterized protein n=1 Tax=Dothistroma septosporum (strain NZE10 / CBS 128990) TaxID=675120 RepID=N1PPE2_DOTSN|nr:hypothetical protein DOTSEDRAFT_23337 [Dothistroma septosporum NZE10]
MSIFKRKGKPAKQVDSTPKKEPAAGQAPMKSYKPKHMSDAAVHGSRNDHLGERSSIYSRPNARSEEMFSQSQAPSMAGSRYGQVRQNSGYFYQARGRSGGYDNTMPFARGRGKADLGKEPSSMTPSYSSDSGYESAGPPSAMHSRAPSVQNIQDPRQLNSPKASPILIPELRLSREPFEQMSEIERVPTGDTARKSQEGILKNVGNVSPLESEYDAGSLISNKSTNKKTRFQDQPEPMPVLDQLQRRREQASTPFAAPSPGQIIAEASKQLTSTTDQSTELAPCEQERISQGATQNLGTAPQMFESLQLTHPSVGSTHNDVSSQDAVHDTQRSANNSRRPSIPPLSILEGLKVNKKGKILDEEGAPIGELLDGDLLDCVRQKANEKGEVLDEYGRVVGTVRTIPSIGDTSTDSVVPSSACFEPQPESATQLFQASRPNLRLHTGSGSDAAREMNVPQHKPSIHDLRGDSPTASHLITAQQQDDHDGSNTNPPPARNQASDQVQSTAQHENMSQAPATLYSDESPYAVSAAPQESKYQSHQELSRPSRSASERSLSELGRSYARPPMDSVPEDNVPEDDIMPVESLDLFAYKGDIPLTDTRLPSRSPIDLNFPRGVLSGGHPGSSMFPQGMPGQLSPAARIPMASRRATTHFTGAYSSNNLNPKLAMMNNSWRSSLSSHETSPKRSENGTDSTSDDTPTMRPPHIRAFSMRSNATSAEKPRTYFTHGGKITVDANTPKPEKQAEPQMVEPVAEKVAEKKKGRFSIGFGKKK